MTAPHNEITAAMPWLYAEGNSWWEVTGRYRGNGTFTRCFAQVVPPEFGGYRPGQYPAVFAVYAGLECTMVPADRISHARRLVFVHADDPGTAYNPDEQAFLDRKDQP